jgi:hypothetical protein
MYSLYKNATEIARLFRNAYGMLVRLDNWDYAIIHNIIKKSSLHYFLIISVSASLQASRKLARLRQIHNLAIGQRFLAYE